MPQVFLEALKQKRNLLPVEGMENLEDDLKRFWSKVTKGKPNECWVWHGANVRGYGQFWFRGKKARASRASWSIHFGEIKNGLWVLHKCDNPPCVNPKHLFLGTRSDNMLDCFKKGRKVNAGWSNKTHCIHGHPFSFENTFITTRECNGQRLGRRVCRICQCRHDYGRKR